MVRIILLLLLLLSVGRLLICGTAETPISYLDDEHTEPDECVAVNKLITDTFKVIDEAMGRLPPTTRICQNLINSLLSVATAHHDWTTEIGNPVYQQLLLERLRRLEEKQDELMKRIEILKQRITNTDICYEYDDECTREQERLRELLGQDLARAEEKFSPSP